MQSCLVLALALGLLVLCLVLACLAQSRHYFVRRSVIRVHASLWSAHFSWRAVHRSPRTHTQKIVYFSRTLSAGMNCGTCVVCQKTTMETAGEEEDILEG